MKSIVLSLIILCSIISTGCVDSTDIEPGSEEDIFDNSTSCPDVEAYSEDEVSSISFTGEGDTITDFFKLESYMLLFDIEYSGDGHFSTVIYGTEDEYLDLVANEIGSFNYEVYTSLQTDLSYISSDFGISGQEFFLEIEADGPWTVSIKQPNFNEFNDNFTSLNGKGTVASDAYYFDCGMHKISVKHFGDRYFSVVAYDITGDYIDLVVNEIGNYEGTTILDIDKKGFYVFDISGSSDAYWTIYVGDEPKIPGVEIPEEEVSDIEIPEVFLCSIECRPDIVQNIYNYSAQVVVVVSVKVNGNLTWDLDNSKLQTKHTHSSGFVASSFINESKANNGYYTTIYYDNDKSGTLTPGDIFVVEIDEELGEFALLLSSTQDVVGSATIPAEVTPVEGCTDSSALNYNSQADLDDGSCEYPEEGTSNILINEDGVNAYYTGELFGSAYLDYEYVVLTEAVSSQNGHLVYEFEPQDFIANFSIYAGDGSGADALWLFAFCQNIAEQEDQNCEGGYHFAFDEWQNQVQLWYDGSYLEGISYNNLGDGAWLNVSVKYMSGNIRIYIEDSLILSYNHIIDSEDFGNLFGFSGRTGGYHNYHVISDIFVTTCESCINEDDDGDGNDDSEPSPYKEMNLCYEVSGQGGNNYHYEWSYSYKKGNGEEGNRNNDTTGPSCFYFNELMDTVDASMRTDPNQCYNCTAELTIEIFIEETETWEICASESTRTSNWISITCIAEEHD